MEKVIYRCLNCGGKKERGKIIGSYIEININVFDKNKPPELIDCLKCGLKNVMIKIN